ncbi:MAG: hypothetical protein M1826_000970 [Phylliscum demangeonii]|nr:MAG: hypothetical protein M1826_000970 [Phylliscum demangeonii]
MDRDQASLGRGAARRGTRSRCTRSSPSSSNTRSNSTTTTTSTTSATSATTSASRGRQAQRVDVGPDEAGYYSMDRKDVKAYIRQTRSEGKTDAVEGSPEERRTAVEMAAPPLCDRCHKLLHNNTGVSIQHPTLASIRDTIWESPYKYNHVYHVLDAADFPMSLIPHLQQYLCLAPPRTQNRRARAVRYVRGRRAEMSFVITRSDLLAPRKEQVDSLMAYLMQVLRDALGPAGKNARLGNLHCVSAKRAWWTKELKEAIWRRGGGGWMVGKVNVGKSKLFEVVFPKGRTGDVPHAMDPDPSTEQSLQAEDADEAHGPAPSPTPDPSTDEVDEGSLLPPAPPEVPYPAMPLVSALPGTTASPIRLAYGNGRGELIDLPGLSRGPLEAYIQEAHRPELVMRQRIKPRQVVLKPGQSLLLGGLIRITPLDPGAVLMAYAFLPFAAHPTSTVKAIGTQTQQRPSGVATIAAPAIGPAIRSAGVFALQWDVTKQRAGPLTRPAAVGLKTDRLPFRVMAADILIEGCGWVELVMQIRKSSFARAHASPAPGRAHGEEGRSAGGVAADDPATHERPAATTPASHAIYQPLRGGEPLGAHDPSSPAAPPDEEPFPQVEIFSPEGKFIGHRRPMGAWLLGAPKQAASEKKARPRRSMKGVKKKLKLLARREAL